jgi:hypothetical protein
VSSAYQLKVTLLGIKPAIWRRLVVPGDVTLERLHRIIQDAMGWESYHLHSFEVRGAEFGVPDPGGWDIGPELLSEKRYTLERLVGEKERFRYTYDFGDDWVHQIVVEKVTPVAMVRPSCVAGARACPPEDCGGVWGYADLVAALSDKDHGRHAELAEWAPAGWAPDRFDLALADQRVAKHGTRPERPRTTRTKRPARTWLRVRS